MSRYIDADKLEPDTEWDEYEDGFISYSQLNIDTAETVDVVEAIPRNDSFNNLIGKLLEIEARENIGHFTPSERAEFGCYVSQLLFDMTKKGEE